MDRLVARYYMNGINMGNSMVYNKFSDYLKRRYGSKVYKLPVNLCVSCPNREGNGNATDSAFNEDEASGNIGASDRRGCIFCGEEGAGFEALSSEMSIKGQLEGNRQYIGKKYGADKFIAYFQNYSNTYLPLNEFTDAMEQACINGVVALYISTRPDCIDDKRIDFLRNLKEARNVDIVIELGLQSVNPRTLRWLKRRHGIAEFVDAVLRIKKAGLEVCTHMINDLPGDDLLDVIEGAKLLSALGVEQVKCHSLYILKNTALGDMYIRGGFRPLSMNDFIDRTISFLEHLSPQIIVQRLIGRAPSDRTLFCNWDTSWWKIHDDIVDKMQREGKHQGGLFDYLNGSALKNLLTYK